MIVSMVHFYDVQKKSQTESLQIKKKTQNSAGKIVNLVFWTFIQFCTILGIQAHHERYHTGMNLRGHAFPSENIRAGSGYFLLTRARVGQFFFWSGPAFAGLGPVRAADFGLFSANFCQILTDFLARRQFLRFGLGRAPTQPRLTLICIFLFIPQNSMDFINPYYATILLGIIQVLGCTLGLVLVNKLGCRGLLLNSLAFCSLTMTGLAISVHMKWQWMSLIMLILFTFSFMSGLSNVPWVLVGELPTGKY